MSQIIRITSEALQATVRRLLPSQQGFGEDLQASNVITPVIDLTPSAQGAETRQDLQSALAFGSCTAFDCTNGSVTLANTPGFWRIYANVTHGQSSGSVISRFNLEDSTTAKVIWESEANNGLGMSINVDFIVFLRAGDSVSVASSTTLAIIHGNYRQIATVTGELVDPVGFTPQ